MKILYIFWTTCEEQTQFLYQEVIERTSHIRWIEQINLKKMVHCLWNQDDEFFLGRNAIHLVILLTCFFIMIQFQ